ncbi:hypothetical protein E2C01_053560 [Portunus trituberculatus]|uniref:Uncharacterized protein n=1 Tax=Portunus trituberculatus TaxID=210409 RepID=A0A5B7GQM5_PORTR|nr:hypothetical protein [Portunus trituberculatus]
MMGKKTKHRNNAQIKTVRHSQYVFSHGRSDATMATNGYHETPASLHQAEKSTHHLKARVKQLNGLAAPQHFTANGHSNGHSNGTGEEGDEGSRSEVKGRAVEGSVHMLARLLPNIRQTKRNILPNREYLVFHPQ